MGEACSAGLVVRRGRSSSCERAQGFARRLDWTKRTRATKRAQARARARRARAWSERSRSGPLPPSHRPRSVQAACSADSEACRCRSKARVTGPFLRPVTHRETCLRQGTTASASVDPTTGSAPEPESVPASTPKSHQSSLPSLEQSVEARDGEQHGCATVPALAPRPKPGAHQRLQLANPTFKTARPLCVHPSLAQPRARAHLDLADAGRSAEARRCANGPVAVASRHSSVAGKPEEEA